MHVSSRNQFLKNPGSTMVSKSKSVNRRSVEAKIDREIQTITNVNYLVFIEASQP